MSDLATADGVVCFYTRNKLHAISATDGSPLWNVDVEVAHGPDPLCPVIADSCVIAAIKEGSEFTLQLFDLHSGRVRARYLSDTILDSSPVYADGRLYVASGDTIFALVLPNLQVCWKSELGGSVSRLACVDHLLFCIVDQDESSCYMYGLNRFDGKTEWLRQLPDRQPWVREQFEQFREALVENISGRDMDGLAEALTIPTVLPLPEWEHPVVDGDRVWLRCPLPESVVFQDDWGLIETGDEDQDERNMSNLDYMLGEMRAMYSVIRESNTALLVGFDNTRGTLVHGPSEENSFAIHDGNGFRVGTSLVARDDKPGTLFIRVLTPSDAVRKVRLSIRKENPKFGFGTNRLYLASEQIVSVINLAQETETSCIRLEHDVLTAPVLSDDCLFIGTHGGCIYAIQ